MAISPSRFSSERIFTGDLDSAEGKTALSRLTRDSRPGSAEATPLGAFVAYVKEAGSVAISSAAATALMQGDAAAG